MDNDDRQIGRILSRREVLALLGASGKLTFNVSQVDGVSCSPLAGVTVDIWYCDALGQYSDVTDVGFDTTGEGWLRGYQVTDANGQASLTTIYPGWYSGRTVHIHFKIRTGFDEANTYEFTSQLFFDETLSDAMFAQVPYAAKGQRDTLNSTDSIYQDALLLAATRDESGRVIAAFDVGLDLSDTETGRSDSNIRL